jgi:hypothetical protein
LLRILVTVRIKLQGKVFVELSVADELGDMRAVIAPNNVAQTYRELLLESEDSSAGSVIVCPGLNMLVHTGTPSNMRGRHQVTAVANSSTTAAKPTTALMGLVVRVAVLYVGLNRRVSD